MSPFQAEISRIISSFSPKEREIFERMGGLVPIGVKTEEPEWHRPPKTVQSRQVIRVEDGKLFDGTDSVIGPQTTEGEFKLKHDALCKAIRNGTKYHRSLYVYADVFYEIVSSLRIGEDRSNRQSPGSRRNSASARVQGVQTPMDNLRGVVSPGASGEGGQGDRQVAPAIGQPRRQPGPVAAA